MENDADSREKLKEFLRVMESDHGITLADIKDALRYYKSVSRWADYFAKTIVGGVAAGFLYAVWQGLFHIFHK